MRILNPVLAVITLLGGLVRFWPLAGKSLWIDESLSARYLDLSPGEIIGLSARPWAPHPPLYFLALRAWAWFWGDSEFALRSLSAACGTASIPGIYLLSRTLEDRDRAEGEGGGTTALVSAALLSANPLQIGLSQLARGYAMGVTLVIFVSWLLLRSLARPGAAVVHWALVGVWAAAACYTSNLALFSVVALGAYAVVARAIGLGTRPGWRPWLGPMMGLLVFALAYLLPWASSAAGQGAVFRHQAYVAPLGPGQFATQTFLAWFGDPTGGWKPPALLALGGLGATAGVLAALARRGGPAGRFLLLTGLVPPLLMVGYSLTSVRSIYTARYLCFAQVSWMTGASLLIGSLRSEGRRTGTIALVAASLAACLIHVKAFGPSAEPGMRAAVDLIGRLRERGEPVIAASPFVFFGADYHARRRFEPRLAYRPGRVRNPFGRTYLRDDELISDAEIEALAGCKVWVIDSESYDRSESVGMPAAWEPDGRWEFRQDRTYENPVVVRRFRVGPRAG